MDAFKTFSGRFKYVKHWLFFFVISFCSLSAFAQPVNDDACAPITLTPSATCTYQTFTTAAATASPGVPAPGCATYNGGDVWFSVVVPAGGALTFDTQAGVITDGGMAIYSGDCNNLVLIECDDNDGAGNMPAITRTGLVPGATIWIRFWKWNGGAGGTFGICVAIPPPPPPPPINDDACAPITLTPTASCTYQTFTNAAATASPGVPAPGCANYLGGDVWFQVVVPAGGTLIFDSQTGVVTDAGMAIYSGDCNNLILIECDDDDSPNGAMPFIYRTGLTPGSTIWVRFWEYGNNGNGTFGICVSFPPPPPANDNCAEAVSLTVNSDLLCAVTTTGSTASATASAATAPTCAATGVNDDVWYSFVATNNLHTIVLSNVTGTETDMAMSVYSGTCGALTHIACSDPNTMTVSGLTIGQTYYVRVWTYVATVGSYANFTICVGTPPPPPANDEPCNAITLTVPENGDCNMQQFTTSSATGTNGVPAPGCASYQGGDVWFKLTVPCTGSIILDAQTGVITDGGMAIYSGTCSNLTLIACDDDGSANGLMPRISRTGLVPGSTLWVRFWEFDGDNNGTFSICAQIPPPPPPASSCSTAQSFCTSTTSTTVPNITGQPSTGGGGVYGCLSTIPNPTYYYLQIQNTGNIDVTISQTSSTGTALDVDFIVWGPFASLNATCTGISAANIVDCSYSIANVEIANIPGATAGQFYLFLVTNFSNQVGSITYQQTGGTGSSNCDIVCTLNAANNGPICSGGSVNLTATTVANATYAWTGPNCFTSTQQNPTGATGPLTPGTYVYTVTATGTNGVACTDTTIVTVIAKPDIGADTSIVKCAGSATNLTTLYNTTGLTTNWTLGGAAVANPAAVTVSGVYQLVAANPTGCTDTAFVTLFLDTVKATVNYAQIVCTQTARITVSNVSGIPPYQYSIGGAFQALNEFVVSSAGSYTIVTRDSLGCTKTDVVTVMLAPPFTVNAGPDISIFAGDEAQIFGTASEPVTSVLWSPPTALISTTTLNTIAKPATTTLYTLSAVNGLGCTATDDVQIIIIPYCVKVKNAFTPNGDGNNDLWQVYDDYGCLKNITVHVFNRYGNKVYESRDYRNQWDGTYSGKPVPDATYYAVLNFTLITGRVVTVKTDLTILR